MLVSIYGRDTNFLLIKIYTNLTIQNNIAQVRGDTGKCGRARGGEGSRETGGWSSGVVSLGVDHGPCSSHVP